MKCLIPLFIGCLISLITFGNDYTTYYKLCNQGDKLMYLKKYQEALQKYDSAFASVDYVHAFKYQKASRCALLLGNNEKGYQYAKHAVLAGYSGAFWEYKEHKTFRKTALYQNLMDSLDHFKRVHQKTINQEYLALIDSLYFIDQNIIRKNQSVKGNYAIDESQLPENRWDLDSLNLQCLLSLIEKYGFPSEKELGVDGYSNASIIIHHNFRLEQNEKYHPIVIDALYSGEYRPQDFSFMYEQFNMWYKNTSFFNTWDKNTSEENIKRLNANREKYLLKDMSSYKLKKNGLKMRSLW